ncbi:MAG: hypothetical protein PHO37_03355 [Kiritimatiellae bacterium]|nr:hypothetical protein [Kiritimatiellia bacterium]
MRNNTNPLPGRGQRGSALLIVLGFLSFMMISAVAFAIYMRIERQASSNYRHAASARHMLNAALYRAMDEVDSDLRATTIAGAPNPRKFPTWPGRVRTSAVVNSADNSANARVLTLGALAYIPGILLNDVRYYALPRPAGAPNAGMGHLGAKWRPLSMPLITMEGLNAYEEAVIGRYAYICINVSDMLNVNYCKAEVRDGAENRVSIGHLFRDDAQRKAFDKRVKESDINYTTLQDFYSCMFEMADSTLFRSPWHDYLNTGYDYEPFRNASKQILITDGVAMAEPVKNPEPHNILTHPPVSDAYLTTLQPDKDVEFQGTFGATLKEALKDNVSAGVDVTRSFNDILPTLLADYLDEDDVPKALNMPSVELAPMISQISVPPLAQAFITTRAAKNADNEDILIYTLDFTRLLPTTFINVEVMWPFKNTSLRTSTPGYTVEVLAYLKVNKVHADQNSGSFIGQAPGPASDYLIELKGNAAAPNQWNSNIIDQEQTCRVVNIPLTAIFNTPGGTPNLDLIDSDGVPYNGFAADSLISVSLVLGYVRIKNNTNNKYVDCVPTMIRFPGANRITEADEFQASQKIFFQSVPSPALGKNMAVPIDLTYAWTCLETPDPRFNWKVSNWIKSDVPEADGRLNKSTRDILALNDGRDADVFMSVSNAGKMQSPGELGYIIRPFAYQPTGPVVDFREHKDPDKCHDYDAMFRTIRLYDHGDPGDQIKRRHDAIYQNFIAANEDGSLIGARVNPLSDIPLVLGAAVERVPLDYWVSYQITDAVEKGNAVPPKIRDGNFSKLMEGSDWKNFTNGWANCLMNVRNATAINTDLTKSLKDEYNSNNYFGWYSATDPDKVLDPAANPPPAGGTPVNLSKALHEVDRKMLYSFTLDSFSDRQQLFLYIISAEATAPSLGDSVKSLAGGKAIALVWRDPYPKTDKAGKVVKPSNMYNDGTKTNTRISPWYQHHRGVDDRSREPYDDDPDSLGRSNDYFEQKVLYFKYLEN